VPQYDKCPGHDARKGPDDRKGHPYYTTASLANALRV